MVVAASATDPQCCGRPECGKGRTAEGHADGEEDGLHRAKTVKRAADGDSQYVAFYAPECLCAVSSGRSRSTAPPHLRRRHEGSEGPRGGGLDRQQRGAASGRRQEDVNVVWLHDRRYVCDAL